MPINRRTPTSTKPAEPAPLRKRVLKPPFIGRATAAVAKPKILVTPKSTVVEKQKTFSVSDARAKLSEIFDYVTHEQARCFVHGGDPKKTKFLAFDYKARHMVEPVIDININLLKSHFATFSTFIRLGACFRVSRRTSNHPVFIRKYKGYTDPLESIMTDYIERRTRNAVEDALNSHSDSETDEGPITNRIEKVLLALKHQQENNTADIMEEVKKISTGIGRMAVNRHPFRDIPLRRNDVVGDDE